MKILNTISLVVLVIFPLSIWGQEKIGTETINIVKPYSPTISDANKIKEQPVVEPEKEAEKEKISYSIFSYPVASTFSSSKIRPEGLDRVAKEKLFSSYLTMGFGNYSTPLIDFYTAHKLDNDAYVGGYLNHLSSWGNIKGELLESPSSLTQLGATYGVNKKKYGWSADLGYRNQMSHWYGIDMNPYLFTDKQVQLIDPKQNYQTIYTKGQVYSKTGFFRQLDMQYSNFSDAKSSAENRFLVTPAFDFKVEKQKVKTDVIVDYVGSNFNQGYFNAPSNTYSNVIVGASPSIVFVKTRYSFNLGAGIFYDSYKNNGATEGKMFVYPKITASYQLVPDYVTAYAGAEGGVQQNSYQNFVHQNPFVSPTIQVKPTDKAYDLYIGLKGKASNSFSFDVKGFYMLENDKSLFKSNRIDAVFTEPRQGYQFGNSFGVDYDNVRTAGFQAGITYMYEKQFNIGIDFATMTYTMDKSLQAWNLPQIKTNLNLIYNIDEKWQVNSKIFYVGSRKDEAIVNSDPILTYGTVELKGYLDANLGILYKYNERLTGFVQLNNLTNSSYEKWNNYSVQQFQALVGASYKFGKY